MTDPTEGRPSAQVDPRGPSALAAISRWIVLALVVATPVVVAPGFTLDQFNLPKLTLLMIGVPVALALRVVDAALTGPGFRIRPLLLPAVAMAVPLIVAWTLSPHRAWAIWGEHTRWQGLVPYLIVILFGLVVYDAFHDDPLRLAWAAVASGACVSIVTIYQMLFSGYNIRGSSSSGYVTATLGHSNFAGGFLAITLALAAALWLGGGRAKWPAAICFALIADGLLFTFSQGAWIAAIGGVAVVVSSRRPERGKPLSQIGPAIAATLGALTVASVVVTQAWPSLVDRYPALESTYLRGFLWRQAALLFGQRPITGWGPNAFALEAATRRFEEEALIGGVIVPDDPHSVPLAFASNAGLIGLLGLALVIGTSVFLWLRARRSVDPQRLTLTAAFGGGLTAYGLQALVSLDEIALRTSMWVCLAGLAAVAYPRRAVPDRTLNKPWRVLVACGVTLAAIATSGWSAAVLLPADHLALSGAKALRGSRVDQGIEDLERAIGLRDGMQYRREYAASLGEAALDAEEAGGTLIEQMRRQFTHLQAQGDPLAVQNHGRYLFAWSVFDRSLLEPAVRLLERAARRDPANPVLATRLGDALVVSDRPEEAVAALDPVAHLLTDRYPRYALREQNQPFWGAVAMAEAAAGNTDEARRAISVSERIGGQDCRTLIASEILAPGRATDGSAAIAFLCPMVLAQVLPDAP